MSDGTGPSRRRREIEAWALGVGPQISWRMNVAQASISRLRLEGPVPSLISFNEVTHLVAVPAG